MLSSGARVGSYEVVAAIGAGGMGEVYRARDTKLHRDVAIKVLTDAFAQDADRLVRFRREAQILASLNHPSIAIVHGLEDLNDGHALVMELVTGRTLAERIDRGPIPLQEAVALARPIADALAAAHDHGIIHRDLKPANIKVTDDGVVKVLDFGLAKTVTSEATLVTPGAAADSPTMTSPAMTQGGVILGTTGYMAPEQARGKPVDKRADIWAFGCVLYEMLTGTRAFQGTDEAETLAAIVSGEPDLSRVPREVRRLLGRCFEKDPRRRLRDIGDVWDLLDSPQHPTSDPARTRSAGLKGIAAAVVTTAAAGLLALWWLQPAATPARPTGRFVHVLGENDQFTRPGRPLVAVARDGNRIAYVANQAIYVRDLDELTARRIPNTMSDPANPVFSPDGTWVAFWSGRSGQIIKVPVSGGPAVALCEAAMPLGASWGTDDRIVFGQTSGIMRVSANGGTPERLVATEAGELASSPQVLPDGRTLLYTRTPTGPNAPATRWAAAEIVVQPLAGGDSKVVRNGGADAHYVAAGYLVYTVGETLFGVPFDLSRLETSGSPVPIVERIRRDAGPAGDMVTVHYSVSDDGTLIHVPAATTEQSRGLVWVDSQGREELVAMEPRAYANPRVSPDGKLIAVTTRDAGNDVWIWDVAHRTLRQLTSDEQFNYTAAWYPDSKRLAISVGDSRVNEVHVHAVDGSSRPQVLPQLRHEDVLRAYPVSISRDERMVLTGYDIKASGDTVVFWARDPAATATVLKAPGNDRNQTISPDGRWLAYQSNRTGRDEISVRPFPNVDTGAQQVTTTGGSMPVWARDGRELYYWTDAGGTVTIMALPILAGPAFNWGAARTVIRGRFATPTFDTQYDVWGDRFLVVKTLEGTNVSRPQIVIVTNWFEELKRLVRAN